MPIHIKQETPEEAYMRAWQQARSNGKSSWETMQAATRAWNRAVDKHQPKKEKADEQNR